MLDDIKVNHLLFMDGLKFFAKNEKELHSLVSTVQVFSRNGIWHKEVWSDGSEVG